MPIVNFTIPKTLETRIFKVIKKKGYTSKAEFFRIAVMDKLEDEEDENMFEGDEEMEKLTKDMGDAMEKYVNKKYGGIKNLPSAREQLKDL